MVHYNKSLKNCRAMIRDIETGEMLSDTQITEHDVRSNILTLNTDHLSKPRMDKVLVIVFAPNCLYEHYGTIRKEAPGINMEIAIFRERQKEDRGYQRYEMKADGRVEKIYIDGFELELRRHVAIKLKNISASGILFEAGSRDFSVGNCVSVRLGLKDSEFTSDYKVVRTQNSKPLSMEYGCKRIEPEAYRHAGISNTKESQDDVSRAEETAKEFLKKQHYYEEKLGYRELFNKVKHLMEILKTPLQMKHPESINDILSEGGGTLLSVAEAVCKSTPFRNTELLLNCCHQKCDLEEAKVRHVLNTSLLSGMLGRCLDYSDEQVEQLVKTALVVGYPQLQSLLGDETMVNMVTAADIYDMRASHSNGMSAAVPFTCMEQMYVNGQDRDISSIRGAGCALAEYILQIIEGSRAVLYDGSFADIVYIPFNDISHPVLKSEEGIWQPESRWAVIGLAVDEGKTEEIKN